MFQRVQAAQQGYVCSSKLSVQTTDLHVIYLDTVLAIHTIAILPPIHSESLHTKMAECLQT